MRHLIASLTILALATACAKVEPTQEPLRAVRAVVVETSSAGETHDYAAEIRARTESRLGFRVGGKLIKRMVNVGDAVRAGQALAQIDPSDLRLGLDAAAAALSGAQAQLALSEAEFKRYKDLRDQGFISGLELERREAAVKAARAQVAQLQAQTSVQTHQSAYATLVADAAGIVTAVEAEPGAVISAGMTILRLAHDGPRDAVFNVPEDRVEPVRALLAKPGAVRLRLWSADGLELPATVREVAAAADSATRTFAVKADLGNAPVRLGQTASVLIDSAVIAGVIKLPLAAVFEHGGNSSVWLLDRQSMTVQPRGIKVGGAEGNRVVVVDGLMTGQTVISAGVHALTPGQRVRFYAEPSARASASVTALPGHAGAAADAASASR